MKVFEDRATDRDDYSSSKRLKNVFWGGKVEDEIAEHCENSDAFLFRIERTVTLGSVMRSAIFVFFVWFGILDVRGERETFADYLPKDCAVFLEVYSENGFEPPEEISEAFDEAVENAEDYLEEENPLEAIQDEIELPEVDGNFDISSLGSHVCLAIGGEANGFGRELIETYQSLQATIVRALAEGFRENGTEEVEDPWAYFTEEQVLELIEATVEDGVLRVPSFYFAFRPKPGAKNEMFAKAKREWEEKIEEGMTMVTLEGSPYEGFGVQYENEFFSDIAENLTGEEEVSEELIELKESLEEALKGFHFTILLVEVDGWVVTYCGNGVERFNLLEDKGLSVSSDESFRRLMETADDKKISVVWRVSESMQEMVPALLDDSQLFQALGESLAGEEFFPMQKDLSKAASRLAPIRKSIAELEVTGPWYGLGYWEKGLRLEMEGGLKRPWLDYETSWALGAVAKDFSPVVRAHSVIDPRWQGLVYDQSAVFVELLSDAIKTFYMDGMLPVSDELIRDSAVGWLETMQEQSRALTMEGLGGERALIVDLNGKVPPLPKIPYNVKEEGKFPRLLYAQGVNDMSQVLMSRKKIWDDTVSLVNKITREMEQTVPLPSLISSEEAGLKFSLMMHPFADEDFFLHSAANEQMAYFGTSKNLTKEFEEKRAVLDGVQQAGSFFEFDIKQFIDYTLHLNEISDSAVLPLGQAERGLDEAGIDLGEDLSEWFGRFGKMTWYQRMEDEVLKTSFRFDWAE